jgi:hypothetical protein
MSRLLLALTALFSGCGSVPHPVADSGPAPDAPADDPVLVVGRDDGAPGLADAAVQGEDAGSDGSVAALDLTPDLAGPPDDGPRPGGHFAPPAVVLTGFCAAAQHCQLADVDGDGRADLVSFMGSAAADASEGDVYVALATDTGFAPARKVHHSFCVRDQLCRAADVDGDHRADLVAFTRGATPMAIVSLASAAGYGQPQVWSNFFCLDGEICDVADLDGDGRSDLVTFLRSTQPTNVGAVYAGLSLGDRFAHFQKIHDLLCVSDEDCAVADLNGDRRADLVAFSPTGDVWVAPSGSTGFLPTARWTDHFCTRGHQCALADVDGDGKADAVAFASLLDPSVSVSLSTGAAFTTPALWLPSACGAGETCRFGDATGDGRADLVIFAGGREGLVSVAPALP